MLFDWPRSLICLERRLSCSALPDRWDGTPFAFTRGNDEVRTEPTAFICEYVAALVAVHLEHLEAAFCRRLVVTLLPRQDLVFECIA